MTSTPARGSPVGTFAWLQIATVPKAATATPATFAAVSHG